MCEKLSPDLGLCAREAEKVAKSSRTAQAFLLPRSPDPGPGAEGRVQRQGGPPFCGGCFPRLAPSFLASFLRFVSAFLVLMSQSRS